MSAQHITSDRESLQEAASFGEKARINLIERQREKLIEEATMLYAARPLTTEDFSTVDRVAMKGDGLRMRWTPEALNAFDRSKEL
jgi:hypothetical protein